MKSFGDCLSSDCYVIRDLFDAQQATSDAADCQTSVTEYFAAHWILFSGSVRAAKNSVFTVL